MPSRKLRIYRLYFTESDCYKSGTRQKSVGVQVHSTGANNPNLKRYVQPDDGRLGRHQYINHHNRSGVDVCASAYIGRLEDGTVAVYQTLPWDMRCWISGKGDNGNANRLGYIGYEICEDGLDDKAYFDDAVMTAAVNLTAHLCELMGTTPNTVIKSFREGDALAVMDHRELHSRGLASGHADINHWLRKYGLSMNDFRKSVSDAMTDGVEVEYVDAFASEEAAVVNEPYEVYSSNGGYVNIREAPSTSSDPIARVYPGDTLMVKTMSSVWSEVEFETETGYIMTQFLRKPNKELPNTISIDRTIAQQFYDALGKALKLTQ